MPQVGVYSAYQLGLHNHLDNNNGGILNDYSRYGAFRSAYRTGALALHVDNDAAKTDTPGPGWIMLKEIRINADYEGQWRISFQMRNADNVTNVSAEFYVNGVPTGGIQNSVSNIYATKTYNYDIDLAENDLLQLWGDPNGDTIDVRQFRIYYDWRLAHFGDGTILNLATPVALSDADLIDVTNTLV